MDLDSTDREILRLLQDNARVPNAEIARKVGKAPSCVFERIRKLEESGVIKGYHAELDATALDLGLTAFILVRCSEGTYEADIGSALEDFPEVQEIHIIAGEDCYLVKIRARDTRTLTELMRKRFGPMKTKMHTKTIIVMDTVKESAALPLEME